MIEKNAVYVYDNGLALLKDLAEFQAKLNNENDLEDMILLK